MLASLPSIRQRPPCLSRFPVATGAFDTADVRFAPQRRPFHNGPFREQTIAPHSAPTVKFTRSALAQEPNVHRGWLYFRKVASPEVSLNYRSLRRRILPRQSISAL
jgi:hypothetical protein